MDIATLLGLVIGVSVVLMAVLTGSDLWIFINIPGLLIVVGGTFAATLIKFTLGSVMVALKVGSKAALTNPKNDPREIIDESLEMAALARKSGVLALEGRDIPNGFMAHGIRLCIDGHNLDVVRKVMTSEKDQNQVRHEEGSKIFRAIGDSAPAFGMIGTLVGLVQMLANMDDPKTIGPAMAIALLTTLYGALIANLICLPIADKLESKIDNGRVTSDLIIEAVSQIHQRQSPMILGDILEAYLPENQRRGSEDLDDEEEGPAETT